MSANTSFRLLTLLIAVLAVVGCGSESEYEVVSPGSKNAFGFDFQTGSLPIPKEPEDNPATEEKFQLGRHLFYDKRLSGNQTMSCESCHMQEFAFADGVRVPTGSTGEVLHRNSQTLTNIAYNATYTWASPILRDIESQLVIPLFGEFPVEMGINDSNRKDILARFENDALYQELFQQAFPDHNNAFTFPNVIKALAVFNRALISKDSPFDKGTMSQAALRGQDLFNSEKMECFHCHNGFNFSDSTVHRDTVFVNRPFFNTGLYNLGESGSYANNDNGLFETTQRDSDKGKFRPTTLRNIGYTAPYMHDGSIETLEEVIEFYAAGGRNVTSGEHQGDGRQNPNKSTFVSGFTLSEQEKQDILAFLGALDDPTFVTNPRYANPFLQEPSS